MPWDTIAKWIEQFGAPIVFALVFAGILVITLKATGKERRETRAAEDNERKQTRVEFDEERKAMRASYADLLNNHLTGLTAAVTSQTLAVKENVQSDTELSKTIAVQCSKLDMLITQLVKQNGG